MPAGVVKQWQEEMRFKFNEDFLIYGDDCRVNQASHWSMYDKVIVSIDRAKGTAHCLGRVSVVLLLSLNTVLEVEDIVSNGLCSCRCHVVHSPMPVISPSPPRTLGKPSNQSAISSSRQRTLPPPTPSGAGKSPAFIFLYRVLSPQPVISRISERRRSRGSLVIVITPRLRPGQPVGLGDLTGPLPAFLRRPKMNRVLG